MYIHIFIIFFLFFQFPSQFIFTVAAALDVKSLQDGEGVSKRERDRERGKRHSRRAEAQEDAAAIVDQATHSAPNGRHLGACGRQIGVCVCVGMCVFVDRERDVPQERGGPVKHSRCATLDHAMKSDTLSARVQSESRANLLNARVALVVVVVVGYRIP